MKVLILTISYPPNVGGVETHLEDLVRWLGSREDLEIEVLTYQPITTPVKGLATETHGRVTIRRINWFGTHLFHKLESKPLLQFLYLAPRLLLSALFHMGRHGPFDVIHAHGLTAIWVATQLKRLRGIPVLGSIHAIYAFEKTSPTAPRIVRVLKGADRILTLSNSSLQQLRQYGFGNDTLHRFIYWVDLRRFRPLPLEACRKRFELPNDQPICLFVGRLIEIKGVRTVIKLAGHLKDLLFVIAGEGPLEEECQSASKDHPNIRFLGSIPNAQLHELYGAADLLLVPSDYEEGFGRVVCESLACGTPVIASNRGGLMEAMNGAPGKLVEPTVGEFSRAIRDWISSSPPIKVRESCRHFAEEHFGEENAKSIENHLRKLLKPLP